MVEQGYDYDLFLSHPHVHEKLTDQLHEIFVNSGITTFYAKWEMRDEVGRPAWDEVIPRSARRSVHLAVFCPAGTEISEWMRREIQAFKADAAERDGDERLILVLPDERSPANPHSEALRIDPDLGGVLRPDTMLEAVHRLTRWRIDSLKGKVRERELERDEAKATVRRGFTHYKHTRFWQPFAAKDHQQVHIFTCGRDTAEDPRHRGRGGRSSIDMWDYQAAADIAQYFGRHYRYIDVTIEQPVRKQEPSPRSFHVVQRLSEQLSRGHCVIIGSPAVSDFAELALADLLGVAAYDPEAEPGAFTLLLDRPQASTFYRRPGPGEREGVRLFAGGEMTFESTDTRSYGVMVVAPNPFKPDHRMLILAGHSGVATRAMSMLLTHEEPWCLAQFFDFDQQVGAMTDRSAPGAPPPPFVAVVEANLTRVGRTDPTADRTGDDRQILTDGTGIRLCRVVPLRPGP